MIRLLIVDDSATYCEILKNIFSQVPDMIVAGIANNGRAAIKMAADLRPDLITMDVNMPDMDGYEATDAILQILPVPIIMVSALNRNHENDFNAMQAGAVAVAEKPGMAMDSNYNYSVKNLVNLVRSMAKIKIFRRGALPKKEKSLHMAPETPVAVNCEIAAIGISTGGPPILAGMLKILPASLPFPICIIQHIQKGFSDSLISWLGKVSALPVAGMADGDTLQPGTVYIAPGGSVASLKTPKTFSVVAETQINMPSPPVNVFFDSINEFYGANVLAALMSGMGRDGVQGLLHLYNSGAQTIVQDRESSVVYGMPEEALKLKAAKYVMTPDDIVGFIKKLAESKS
jgi:two-component system chemotaxis response regulator CheB